MMEEMQFTAIVMTILMSLSLVFLLPGQITHDRVANRSRWLLIAGLLLLSVQFLLQYVFGFRQMGTTQAVLVNLFFFIPSSALFSLCVLNLQRQGEISRWEWLMGPLVWLFATVVLFIAWLNNGFPLRPDPLGLRWGEWIASLCYGLMQVYYTIVLWRELFHLQVALDNYYDKNWGSLLRWMKLSVLVLILLAVFVPVIIYSSGWLLAAYGLLFFFGVFYLWFCFVRYVIGNAIGRVREADQSVAEEERERKQAEQLAGETSTTLSDETFSHVSKAVQTWMEGGGHLRSGITNPQAAREMQIPRYQLTAWVKASGYESFTRWITVLRIEEAKRMLILHPQWSNEAIADHCGFSRTYFQRVFKQETGCSPATFLEQNK